MSYFPTETRSLKYTFDPGSGSNIILIPSSTDNKPFTILQVNLSQMANLNAINNVAETIVHCANDDEEGDAIARVINTFTSTRTAQYTSYPMQYVCDGNNNRLELNAVVGGQTGSSVQVEITYAPYDVTKDGFSSPIANYVSTGIELFVFCLFAYVVFKFVRGGEFLGRSPRVSPKYA